MMGAKSESVAQIIPVCINRRHSIAHDAERLECRIAGVNPALRDGKSHMAQR